MTLTRLLIPSLLNQLQALSGWLDKAETFATVRGESENDLLTLRLTPDMFPLTTQLRFLAFQAQEPVYRLRNEPVPEDVLEVRQEGRDGAARSNAVLPSLSIGERVRIVPNHACATAAQHGAYHVVQGTSPKVQAKWARFGGW